MDVLNTTGSPDLSNIDICKAVGPNAAYDVTVSRVNVTNGSLGIQSVYGAADDPEVTSIEIIPDQVAPSVTQTTPLAGAKDIPVASPVSAGFSEAMTASTFTNSTFTLTGPGGAAVPAAVTYNPSSFTATLQPNANLAFGTNYTATLTTGVKASDGTPLSAPVTWSFTTHTPHAPGVTSTFPTGGATGVSPAVNVRATFDQALDPTTVTASSFTLAGPGGNVSATVSYDSSTQTAKLVPQQPLAVGTTYTATLSPAITSATDGVGLAGAVSWSFTTAATAPAPPSITPTPAAGATGVALATTVQATFSRDMYAPSISGSSFTLSSASGLGGGNRRLRRPVSDRDADPVVATDGERHVHGDARLDGHRRRRHAARSLRLLELHRDRGADRHGSLAHRWIDVHEPDRAGDGHVLSRHGSDDDHRFHVHRVDRRLGRPRDGDLQRHFAHRDAHADRPAQRRDDVRRDGRPDGQGRRRHAAHSALHVVVHDRSVPMLVVPGCAAAGDDGGSRRRTAAPAPGRSPTSSARSSPSTSRCSSPRSGSSRAQARPGIHTGRLWSAAGTLLAQQQFATETDSGWQTQALAAPFTLQPGTTYTISVNANAFFGSTLSGLATQNVSGPLRTVADGSNGVYGNAGGTFPTLSYSTSNYFADGVFVPNGDPGPLGVLSTSPANNATSVARNATISVQFSRTVDPATLTSSTFQVTSAGGAVAGDHRVRRPLPDRDVHAVGRTRVLDGLHRQPDHRDPRTRRQAARRGRPVELHDSVDPVRPTVVRTVPTAGATDATTGSP